jgi:hypothetical protein
MADFTIKENDRLPILTMTLKDAAGAVIDLVTNVSGVKLIMNNSSTGVNKINAPASSTSVGGVMTYEWAAGDTDTVGTYNCEVQITYTSGKPLTVPTSGYKTVEVTADLGD